MADNSLGFDLLDRHVVDGRGDELAYRGSTGSLTFSRVLERAAALAGGLAALGVASGDNVAIDLPEGAERVIAVCAVIRLGAIPAAEAPVVIREENGQALIEMRGETVDFELLERAGRSDPAPALRVDVDGYRNSLAGSFVDIVGPLLGGSSVV